MARRQSDSEKLSLPMPNLHWHVALTPMRKG